MLLQGFLFLLGPIWGFYSTPGCPTSLLCWALRALYITVLYAPLYYLLSTVLFSLHSYLVSQCSPPSETILSRHSKKKPWHYYFLPIFRFNWVTCVVSELFVFWKSRNLVCIWCCENRIWGVSVKDGQAQLVLHGMPAQLQSKVVPAS